MKISGIRYFPVRAGWRDWGFLKVETDAGVVGWADCTEAHGSTPALRAAIEDLGARIVGRDPMPIELIFEDLYRITRQSAGGTVQKALAAIENALLDVKARALGISVAGLLGGPTRSRVDVYWSHWASTRIRSQGHLGGARQVAGLDDIPALIEETRSRGFRAIKTNMIMFEEAADPWVVSQGFRGGEGSFDRNVTPAMIAGLRRLLTAIREAAGPDLGIILDVNMHLRADGLARVARALEAFDLTWLEVDLDDPGQLAALRAKAPMPIGSGESKHLASHWKPFLDARALDVGIIDVRWSGVLRAKKIADLARLHDVNVAPHNHGSPLASLMAAQFCASIVNARIMEFDVDDVPWRDEITAEPLSMMDGQLILPSGPGWGLEIDQSVLEKHAP